MPIRFYCRICDGKIKVPYGSQGLNFKCPKCGQMQPVPDRSTRGAHAVKAGAREPALVGAGGRGSQSFSTSTDEFGERLNITLQSSQWRGRGCAKPPAAAGANEQGQPIITDAGKRPGRAMSAIRSLRALALKKKPASAPPDKSTAQPTYALLNHLSWLLRATAVVTFAAAFKLMLIARGLGLTFWAGMMIVFVGSGLAITIWAVGEGLEVLREVARRTYRD